MVSTEVDRYTDVDPADVPSAQWGWSKINYRTWHIAGLCGILFLLAMLRGNHVGRVEDYFLIGFALIGAFFLIRDWWGRRRGWLR
ncbi:DUF2631 domain-containing protein [Mycolicibacterium mengxianglii]|uniref:DUF2631 domain-containing protein n=1 Tax=Mycolicibacterium mengxianglii TaxID=2736649 RepID=UPI001E37F6DF|nr:DUF2631 domain-containing protein [Mycolicibacterium mengxianglii]